MLVRRKFLLSYDCRPLEMLSTSSAVTAAYRVAQGWTKRVGRLLYPPACLACDTPMEDREAGQICSDCLDGLKVFSGPTCGRCGASTPLSQDASETCGNCQKHQLRFDRAWALAEYDGLLRDLVLRAKKLTGESVAGALATVLARQYYQDFAEQQFDVVCCVPMHWQRRLWRQTNSPEVIGEVVAHQLKLPFLPHLVRRRRRTRPQSSLAASRRGPNVRGAFSLGSGYKLYDAHVLIVDDILTTGATCNELTRVLRNQGAKQVSVAVVARSFTGK